MKKSISQRDIAQMLGVNVSTVSRALKGLPDLFAVARPAQWKREREKHRHQLTTEHQGQHAK